MPHLPTFLEVFAFLALHFNMLVMQLNLTANEEVEIKDEVDGWYYASLLKPKIFPT